MDVSCKTGTHLWSVIGRGREAPAWECMNVEGPVNVKGSFVLGFYLAMFERLCNK